MPPEKSNHPKIPSRKRWSCLPSCFVGSLVSGSDRPGPSAGRSKPKLSWSRYRKKKKTAPLDGVRPNIKASAQKNSPSEDGTSGRSRGNPQQLGCDANSQLHPGMDSGQPRLPEISKKYSTRRGEAPPSWKPNTIRTRSTTSHPGSPVHIHPHPATSHKSPVRTSSLKPTAGIWVMVMTLAMMVFFGRASALICLCSCIFLVPLLSAGKDDGSDAKGVASREVDMNSEEYKKRVILEGLLERNGRKPSGF